MLLRVLLLLLPLLEELRDPLLLAGRLFVFAATFFQGAWDTMG